VPFDVKLICEMGLVEVRFRFELRKFYAKIFLKAFESFCNNFIYKILGKIDFLSFI
jgi:hypothetical protein